MAKKKTTKKTKKVAAPEMIEVYKVILLGLKFNRAEELRMALNDGWVIKSEIESKAGKYIILTTMVPVEFCEDCGEVHV